MTADLPVGVQMVDRIFEWVVGLLLLAGLMGLFDRN